jgi:hypothetical protein
MTTRTYAFIHRHFLVALVVGLSAVALGCEQGAEGDRCVLALSHNDCNSGLVCTQPSLCPETYCCPPNVTSTSSPYCQEGCNGGAAAICEAPASSETDAACAFNAKHPYDAGYKEPD